LLPVIGVVALVVVGGGAALVASSNTSTPTPTFTPSPTHTAAPSPTAFTPPEGVFNTERVALRDAPSETAPIRGEFDTAGVTFIVRARSSDSQWLRVEFADGTDGWVPASVVDLGDVDVKSIPAALTLATPTPTATATAPPTDTPTPAVTLAPTNTPVPTRPPATRPPATPTLPAQPPATATTSAQVPLGWGFEHQFCTLDGDNYTCNVLIWGTGGDGRYHYAVENPDTGSWDEKTGPNATYLVRWRRCRIRNQQVRIWDESGNHIEPNLTTDPGLLGHLFPGGTCTEP
jgi:hypothetical protein